jgi:hypothetical protein
MNETDELEPQQYQHLYKEEDVPLKDVRKSVLRKFVYIGAGLCLVFLMIWLFVKFPDQVELPFEIKSNQSEEIYRFSNPVYVIDKYVKPQDIVSSGQPLVRITSVEIVTLINSYLEAEQNLLNFSKQKLVSVEKQKEIISNKIAQSTNDISEVQHEMATLDSSWKSNLAKAEFENNDAIYKYNINKKLFDEGVISKNDLTEFETRKIRAADVLITAEQNYGKLKYSLEVLYHKYLLDNNSSNEELKKIDIDTKYDSVSLSNQYALAKNKIKNTFGDFELRGGDLVLKANANGIVSFIFEGEKEVAPSAILLKVINSNASYYALVKSPPSLIGRISKNMQSVLKIASFPFYEWGTVKGHVEELSLTPDESGNFSVRISIDNFGNMKHVMRIGMNGDATIILEEKTLYYYFFRKAKQFYYSTTMSY